MPHENECLGQLLAQSWHEYDRLEGRKCAVRPAIPILFFGDSERYFSSRLKVLTVGLNPSSAEFPDNDRLSRFPAALGMSTDPTQRESSRHLAALNSYFRTDPYMLWFASLEQLLNGMGCSFGNLHGNTALHTDLCSPIATSPTWNELSKDQQAYLLPGGVKLWHLLVKALSPDIILVSVAQKYLDLIEFHGPSRVIWKLDELNRKRPYKVTATAIKIQPNKPSLLIFGRAAQKPFALISDARKKELGAIIKEHYYAD